MKLTEEQKNLLLRRGYTQKDFGQIEKAIGRTSYTIVTEKEERDAKEEEVIATLGMEEWLSGVARSAFHWSASRKKGGTEVLFDSRKLFR